MKGYSMKTSPSATTLPDPEQILHDELDARLANAREQFLSTVAQLPQPFNVLAENHYLTRGDRAADRQRLGESVPWVVADALSVPLAEADNIAIPWLFLYEYILVVDDLIDAPSRHDKALVVLSGILLERAVRGFAEYVNHDPLFWVAFEKYADATAEAGAHELISNCDANRRFDRQEHVALGRKSSLTKLAPTLLLLKLQSRLLSQEEEEVFDDICAAVQLLDDFTDFHEDYRDGNFTYPVATSLTWLASIRGVDPATVARVNAEDATAAFVLSGAAAKTTEEIETFLKAAVAKLQRTSRCIVDRYTEALVARNDYARTSLGETLSDMGDPLRQKMVNALVSGGSASAVSPSYWSRLQQTLRIFAQADS